MFVEEQTEFFDSFKGVMRLNCPLSVIKDNALTPTDKMLYLLIDALGYKSGYCWASNKALGKYLGVSDRTIIREIQKLEEKGYIKKKIITYKGQTRRHIFTVEKAGEIFIEEHRKEISQKDIDLANMEWLDLEK